MFLVIVAVIWEVISLIYICIECCIIFAFLSTLFPDCMSTLVISDTLPKLLLQFLHWLYQPRISKNSSDLSFEDDCTVLIFRHLGSELDIWSVAHLLPNQWWTFILLSFNRGTSLPTCFYFLHSPNPQILTEEPWAEDCTLVLARTQALLVAFPGFLPLAPVGTRPCLPNL